MRSIPYRALGATLAASALALCLLLVAPVDRWEADADADADAGAGAGFWTRRWQAASSWLDVRFDARALQWALAPPRSVHGHVVGGWSGEPVPGATVALRASFDTDDGHGARDAFVEVARTTSDEHGGFRFRRPPGAHALEVVPADPHLAPFEGRVRSYFISCKISGGGAPHIDRKGGTRPRAGGGPEGGVSFDVGGDSDPGDDGVVLEVDAAAVLRLRYDLAGLVMDGEAESLAGRSVAIVLAGSGPELVRTATIGAHGVAEFTGVPFGTWRHDMAVLPITRTAGPDLMVPLGFRVQAVPGETVDVDVPVAPVRTVRARLVDEDGAPVAGAELSITTVEPTPPFMGRMAWGGRSNEQGVAEVRVLSGQILSAHVLARGWEARSFGRAEVDALRRGDGPELVIAPPAEERFEPNVPLRAAVRGLEPEEDGDLVLSYTDVGLVPPGDARLSRGSAGRVDTESGESTHVVPPGRYLVAAWLHDTRFGLDAAETAVRWPVRSRPRVVDVHAGMPMVEIERESPGVARLLGRVTDSSGAPASRVALAVEDLGPESILADPILLWTDDRGRFELLDVPAGAYRVRILEVPRSRRGEGVGSRSSARPVLAEVGSGGVTEVELVLPAETDRMSRGPRVRVSGRIGAVSGAVGAVEVVALDRFGEAGFAKVTQEGRFDLTCRTDGLDRVEVRVPLGKGPSSGSTPYVLCCRAFGAPRVRDVDLGSITLPSGSVIAGTSGDLRLAGDRALGLVVRGIDDPSIRRELIDGHAPFLPDGRYEVLATLHDGRRCAGVEPETVEIAGGQHVIVELDVTSPD